MGREGGECASLGLKLAAMIRHGYAMMMGDSCGESGLNGGLDGGREMCEIVEDGAHGGSVG
jgi:hypothetical protein